MINQLSSDESFGAGYPLRCRTGKGTDVFGNPAILGCDMQSFAAALQGDHPKVAWPLDPKVMPPEEYVFDLLEFCYQKVGLPVARAELVHMHEHYTYNRSAGQARFVSAINRIFARNQLAFELSADGYMVRRVPTVFADIVHESEFTTKYQPLNSLLVAARDKFLDADNSSRREALKELWDAWEYTKNLGQGKDTKAKVESILRDVAPEDNFFEVINMDAMELSKIGNAFNIRHAREGQVDISSMDHVDYLFYRLYALLHLVLKSQYVNG